MNRLSESCDAHDGYVQGCVGCLRAWLDRKPPPREEALDSYEDEPERERLVCLVHGTSTCAHETCPAQLVYAAVDVELHLHSLETGRPVDLRDWYEFAELEHPAPRA